MLNTGLSRVQTMENVVKINDYNLAALKNKRSGHPKYLNDLIASLHTCAENYKKLANESALSELGAIADKLSSEREEFAFILKEGFSDKTGNHHNILNKIKPVWSNVVKGIIYSEAEQTTLDIILKSELKVVKKYDTYLYHHIPTVEQLKVLLDQRKSASEAVELLKAGYNLQAQPPDLLLTDIAQ